MNKTQLGWTAIALSLLATPALAHTSHGTGGLMSGLEHPLAGWDHLLAMAAVGLWGARQQGAARWGLPLTFVGFMVAGSLLGFGQLALPKVEMGVALSVVFFGLVLLAGRNLMLPAALSLTALFALFHGHAHGAELPSAASAFSYLAGFVLTTALLHLAGIVAGDRIRHSLVFRLIGTALATTGLVMAV